MNITPPVSPAWKKWSVLSFGFRPFYLLASIYGVIAIILWAAGFKGTSSLLAYYPYYFWHAHEMIWGYTVAVIAGFLLTAVVNWTGIPSARYASLLSLVIAWIGARVTLYLPDASGIIVSLCFSMAFYLGVIYWFAKPIIQTKNKRNYLPIAVVVVLALTQLGFDVSCLLHDTSMANNFLFAGLLLVVSVISLVGMRILPFFTARRLGSQQRNMPMVLQKAGILLPIATGLVCVVGWYPVAAVLALLITLNLLYLLYRAYAPGVLREPMLWILYFGLGFTGLGVSVFMVSYALGSASYTAGVHMITIGGIGCLTLGMMARTTLGHTGRMMKAVFPMPYAFACMIIACIFRIPMAFVSSSVVYHVLFHASATFFCLSLILFLLRYASWLWKPSL